MPFALQGVEVGDRVQQSARVRMTRTLEQREYRAKLDDASGVHDRNAIGHLRHHTEIVRDQQDRGAEPLLEVGHEREDLRLNGHVESGGRLVGDQHPGAAGKRHGDHHPLQHAPGELVRVLSQTPLGLGDLHHLQHLDRPVAGVRRRRFLVVHDCPR